jgi:hypothetical protein
MPTIALDDEELAAVTAAVRRTIREDKFPMSPRLDPLKAALSKLDPQPPRPAIERPPLPEAPHAQPWRQAGPAMIADDLRAKLFEDRVTPGDWRVERIDEDGSCEVAIFSGPGAYERAVRYADRQYGQFDEISLAPYRRGGLP